MAIEDQIRFPKTPATGAEAGNKSIVDSNLQVEDVLYIPIGETDTLNGGKDRDGAIRLTLGKLSTYFGGVWRKLINMPTGGTDGQVLAKTGADVEWVDATVNNFKGTFTTYESLVSAYPTAIDGNEAIIDAGVGTDAIKYIWDSSDNLWVAGGGSGASSFTDLAGSPYDNPSLANALDFKANLPNELISGGVTSVVTDDINITPATWRINGTVYTKSTSTAFTDIANSAIGKQRYIAFYGNTSNGIDKIEGAELNLAIMPNQPANTALISYVLVGDSGIGEPATDLSGFALKADVGDKTDLTTDRKINIVDSVNEINGSLNSLQSDQVTLKIFKVSNYATL